MTDTYPPATSAMHIDDEKVRVTEWTLEAGSATGWHKHEMAYVIVPTSGGPLRIATPTGDVAAEMVVGKPYIRPSGVEHNVINDGPGKVVFMEIELKEPASA